MEINKTVTINYRPIMDKNQFDTMRALCFKIKAASTNKSVDCRICVEVDDMRVLFNKAIKEAFYQGLEIGKEGE